MINQLPLFAADTPPADPVPEGPAARPTVELWHGDLPPCRVFFGVERK